MLCVRGGEGEGEIKSMEMHLTGQKLCAETSCCVPSNKHLALCKRIFVNLIKYMMKGWPHAVDNIILFKYLIN